MPTTSIDDVLLDVVTNTRAPEPEIEIVEDVTREPGYAEKPLEMEPVEHKERENVSRETIEEPKKEAQEIEPDDGEDEYGNAKDTNKDNEVIRERLARQAESLKRQHQAELEAVRQQLLAQQQNAATNIGNDFEYNPDSSESWDVQLRKFVEQTVSSMSARQQQQQRQMQEQQLQQQFEDKFIQGMSRFNDYVETVGSQPITDDMIKATRMMKDPAAFLYAASKRMPQELQRIASIPDPYYQAAEMGRLEAQLRQSKQATKAPKPVAKTHEDGTIRHESEREPTIEELIKQAEARKAAQIKSRMRR